jgi:predicted TIM-barrel fold metal-dependent hydrolase
LIDGHVHIWVLDPARYPWQQTLAHVPIPDAPAGAEMLMEAMDAAVVSHAILVQPSVYGWDNGYMCDCLDRWPGRFAAICLVDPRSADAARHLQHWVGERGCCGVRINLISEPDAAWIHEESRTALWEMAAGLEVSISLQMRPRHVDAVAGLAARYPDTPFVVDYLGKEAFHDGSGPEALAKLAARPNMNYKILTLGQDSKQPYPYEDLRPLYAEAYRRFGRERLVFGTDFPHVLGHGSYAEGIAWIETLPFLDASARGYVTDANARRLWRLAD